MPHLQEAEGQEGCVDSTPSSEGLQEVLLEVGRMKCEYPYCWKMAKVLNLVTGHRVCLEHEPRLERAAQKVDSFRKSKWEPPV